MPSRRRGPKRGERPRDPAAPAGNPPTDDGTIAASRGPYRIHVVAELTGVPEPTLRAWERRYHVPAPDRTASGYRLYSAQDVELVREMRRLCGEGVAAAEAARLVGGRSGGTQSVERPSADAYADAVRALVDAVVRFDDVALDAELRRVFYLGPSTAAYDRVLAPALVQVGVMWHDGRISVAQEHLASQRIGAVVRDITRLVQHEESEDCAVVACFADEEHEIGALGVAMRLSIWRLRSVFLGARTPPVAIRTAVEALAPKLVALSTTVPVERARARELVDGYASACGNVPWLVGGAAADGIADLVRKAGGLLAPSDASSLRAAVRLALGRTTGARRVQRSGRAAR
jgi:DNA-binding transcriptional MerR regulator